MAVNEKLREHVKREIARQKRERGQRRPSTVEERDTVEIDNLGEGGQVIRPKLGAVED